jgi:hypothetical protein
MAQCLIKHRANFTIYPSIYLFIYLRLYNHFLGLGRFFSFLIFYTVGRTRDHPFARPLPAHRTAQTQIKHTHTSMPQVVFEPTIPMFERTKTVHTSDRAAIVIGQLHLHLFFSQVRSCKEEIKRRLNSGNACSARNLSSRLLSKNIKIRI